MSSAAGRFGGGSADEPFFHHRGVAYHVPQYSRREKLRFPQEVSPPPPPPPSFLNPPLYQPNGAFLPNLLPSSSCSSSYLYSPNPNYSMAHLVDGSSLHQGQIQQQQGFSLTLSPPPPQAPLGPFTGYSAVLNRSRFLDPARKLLEEMCDVDRAESVSVGGDPPAMLSVDHEVEGRASGLAEELQWKKARLISMIDEVCKRYMLYYQQVQIVIRSFEMVVGLSTTAPYVLLALKSMFKHFRCLKNAIYNQLNHINGASGKEGFSITEISCLDFTSGEPGVACAQQGGSSSGAFSQAHVWRHQRGLPERAVSVLRAWLFEHFLHPYPTDVDKQMLAKQTRLTRSQVSNWFINARVRLWKPMVEEIHNLEMQAQPQEAAVADESETPRTQASRPSSTAATSSSNQPPHNSCTQRNQNSCSRLMYNELSYIAHHIEEPYSYDTSGRDHAAGVGAEGTAGVSLTLGLHQNTGIRIPEPLVLNVARHFSLEDINGTYGVGAFEGQVHRHFGKDIGGHLLQDFVG